MSVGKEAMRSNLQPNVQSSSFGVEQSDELFFSEMISMFEQPFLGVMFHFIRAIAVGAEGNQRDLPLEEFVEITENDQVDCHAEKSQVEIQMAQMSKDRGDSSNVLLRACGKRRRWHIVDSQRRDTLSEQTAEIFVIQ